MSAKAASAKVAPPVRRRAESRLPRVGAVGRYPGGPGFMLPWTTGPEPRFPHADDGPIGQCITPRLHR